MNYIIITGASKGLGKALSLKLGNTNNKLYLVARNLKTLQAISSEIENNEGKSEEIKFDFSNNINEIPKLIESIIKDIDLDKCTSVTLINNAASIKPIEFIGNLVIDDIISNLNTNCLSSMILINEFIKKVSNFKGIKKIINISSGVCFKPLSGWSLYSTSKSAVHTFLETLALEQKNNIKVVSFDPGVMNTDIQNYIRKVDKNKFDFVDEFTKYYKEGVLVSPDLVANKIIDKYINNWMATDIFEKIDDH